MNLSYFGEAFLYITLLLCGVGFLSKKSYFLYLTCFTLLCSLCVLFFAHLTDNFSFLDVVMHSHTHKPLLYKICGVWGYHEGSFLILIALYALVTSLYRGNSSYTSCCCLVLFTLVSLTLIQVNPFLKLSEPALQGEDLNPVLQDIMISIHPPILYIGHALLLILFGIGCTTEKISRTILSIIQKWARASWFCLTLGIMLGSFWAYHELGWGGVWFWDPVENLSLLPWFMMTLLLHSLRIRGTVNTIRLLAISGFLTSCLCLLIVRSGIVVSVHNFALSEQFLVYYGSATILFCCIGAYSFNHFYEKKVTHINRLLRLHYILIGLFFFILILGVLYPLISVLWGENGVVNESFYQSTLAPFLMSIPLAASFAYTYKKPYQAYMPYLVIGLASFCISLFYYSHWPLLAHGYHAVAWILVIISLLKINRYNIRMICGHIGLGLMMLGLVYAHYNQTEHIFNLSSKNQPLYLSKEIQLIPTTINHVKRSNHNSERLFVKVIKKNRMVGWLKPERRAYWVSKLMHHESATLTVGTTQLYGQLLSPDNKKLQLQVITKPWICLVWAGVVIMLLSMILPYVWCRFDIFDKLMSSNTNNRL